MAETPITKLIDSFMAPKYQGEQETLVRAHSKWPLPRPWLS